MVEMHYPTLILTTFITVTVKEVADVAADLPRMKATALSPWSNELISLVLKDNPALQDTL
jgi:hypothetical protein